MPPHEVCSWGAKHSAPPRILQARTYPHSPVLTTCTPPPAHSLPVTPVLLPGTYQGMVERLDYLKDLGVNAVELLPVQVWGSVGVSGWLVPLG